MIKIESSYLELFDKAREDGHPLTLTGNTLLVERVPQKEIKTASGIVLQAAPELNWNSIANDRPHWAIVLAVGEGYYDDETEKDIPLDVEPGDVILLGKMSASYFSTLDVLDQYITLSETYQRDTIGVTRESEILAKFPEAAVYRVGGVVKKEDGEQLELPLGEGK